MKWKAAYQQVTDKQHSAGNKPSLKTITNDQKALGIEYRSILDVKPEIAVSAGIGAGFDYKVFLQDSKLYMSVKGNMVVGVGGGGSIAAELDGKQIWELVKFIRWSLEQSDFRFLDWVDEGVFEQITLLMKALVVTKADFNELVSQGTERIEKFWTNLNKANTRVRDVAYGVISNNELINLTPAAKAGLLEVLMEDSSASFGFKDPYRAVADKASMWILETVTSHRELVEILKMIGNDGRKGGFHSLRTNYVKLIVQRLLHSSQSIKAEEWLSRVLS